MKKKISKQECEENIPHTFRPDGIILLCYCQRPTLELIRSTYC